jgi:carboxylesterase type B
MIWIHGGQFTSGAAQEYPYKNAIRNLVSRDVVVVTIQYRLGFLGNCIAKIASLI